MADESSLEILARIADDIAAIRASTEREALLDAPSASSSAVDTLRIVRPTGLSRFKCHADIEIRDTIAAMLGNGQSLKICEVHDQLVASFGRSRVPAVSSLHRYVQALIAAGQAVIVEK